MIDNLYLTDKNEIICNNRNNNMYQTEISSYRNIFELDECTVGIHIIRLT